ncbi:trigger factor [Candidatus Nomurabacteria bacterium]|jgi:trigger factor|nr:trigger factor [Candidatus Saccharibacteria bacterium]MCB9839872.1 trigger factor [Candidatus Nomurabacteria bacterium]
MQITKNQDSDTNITLIIKAEASEIIAAKNRALNRLAPKVKLSGFRTGKVPMELVEKNLDPNYLQTEVIDEALNELYVSAVNEENIRPVAQPKVDLVKFVPYEELEFKAEVEVIGKVKMPDYKKLGVKRETVKVTKDDIDEVLERLRTQLAEHKEVTREAHLEDRAWIDFDGHDTKGLEVKGASGKEYPLLLGSKTFIPGFEDQVVGMKVGSEKEFTIPFPKDYAVKALQGKKVTFKVKLTKLEEVTKPKLDDSLATKAGPFKTMSELKEDIKKQLSQEKENQAQKSYEDLLVKELAAKTKVALPVALVDEQINSVDQEFRQNLLYRSETFQEYLDNSGQSEEEYRTKELRPVAEERLRAGLALSEVADLEKITVTPEELEIRMQVLKGQYSSDQKMQEELDKPSARKDIASRLLTEKTISKLVALNTK